MAIKVFPHQAGSRPVLQSAVLIVRLSFVMFASASRSPRSVRDISSAFVRPPSLLVVFRLLPGYLLTPSTHHPYTSPASSLSHHPCDIIMTRARLHFAYVLCTHLGNARSNFGIVRRLLQQVCERGGGSVCSRTHAVGRGRW